MNQSQRRAAAHARRRSPEGRKHPRAYSARQLEDFLVGDACRGHATDLAWAMAAYEEIARQRHGRHLAGEALSPHAEEAFLGVLARVEKAGKRMPVTDARRPA